MATATGVCGSYLWPEFSRSSPPSAFKITAQIKPSVAPPPIFISTIPAHVNLYHLQDLYALCNHSCHRFPAIDSAGRVEPVDIPKLRTALSHSSVVVSVFTKPEFVDSPRGQSRNYPEWIRRVAPVNTDNGRLIGFGRAVSDSGLTASIYDVMVHPTLQGRGIGKIIVKRIIRMLIQIDIYDISAICTATERSFFGACGFGDDVMGSKTMMYARSASSCSKDEGIICAGRKQLLVPPPREKL